MFRTVLTSLLAVLVLCGSAFAAEKTLIAAANPTWPPMEFLDENKNIIGYDRDIIAAIAEEIGMKSEFRNIAWDGIFASLESGQANVIASCVTITDKRKKAYVFSDPYYEVHQAVVVAKDSAIKKPEDLKGLKLRVTPDKMRLDTFKLLGAAPMAINFGELYSALQQGVVDGQENPYAIIYSNAFNEVQKYLSKSGHIWGSAVLCVNSDVWNKLSAKDKETVRKLAQKWCAAQRKETIKEENEFLDKLKAKGMKVNDVDKAAFQKAVQPVWKSYESTFGKELMDMVHEYGK